MGYTIAKGAKKLGFYEERRLAEFLADKVKGTVEEYPPCSCEHTNHFDDEYGPRKKHRYLEYPADSGRIAMYVGEVCKDCAENCVPNYLLPEADEGL